MGRFLNRLVARAVPPKFTEPGPYRVVLQVPGSSQVALVREIRRTTGKDLQSAVAVLREAPAVLVEGLSERSAELVAEQLRQAGARAVAHPIEEV